MSPRAQRRGYRYPLIIAGIFIVVAALHLLRAFDIFEHRIYDMRFLHRNLFAPPRPSGNVVILKIDEESVARLGRWPWDRKVVAEGVRRLYELGATVVGLDILYTEPQDKPGADAALAEAIAKGPTVLASTYETRESMVYHSDLGRNVIISTVVLLEPIPLFKRNAALGYVNIHPDSDGTPRWVALRQELNGRELVFLSAQVYERYSGVPVSSFPRNVFINYYGPADIYPQIPFWQVHDSTFAVMHRNSFKNKIVLMGSFVIGAYDHYPNPFSESYPGVLVHANIIENLMQRAWIRIPPTVAYLVLMLLVCAVAAVLFRRVQPVLTAVTMACGVAGYYCTTLLLFTYGNTALEVVPVSLLLLAIGFYNIIDKFLLERQEKARMKGTFSKIVSPQIMTEMLRNAEGVKLGGEKRDITVLFSDIRGFTTMSEKLEPTELVALLNEYFEEMTDVVFKYDGTFDKFIGDAVMAFWNSPVAQENHVERAVRCAMDMVLRLDELNKRFTAEGKPNLAIGIGINTGPAVVGFLGSTKIMPYTAIGDTVNTASRLESMTKEYKAPIIVSEYVERVVGGIIPCVSLGTVKVRGRAAELGIFKVDPREHTSTIQPA